MESWAVMEEFCAELVPPSSMFTLRLLIPLLLEQQMMGLTQCEGLCSHKQSLIFRGTRCLMTSGNNDDTDKE